MERDVSDASARVSLAEREFADKAYGPFWECG